MEEEVNEKLRRKEPDVEGNQNAKERTITEEESPRDGRAGQTCDEQEGKQMIRKRAIRC